MTINQAKHFLLSLDESVFIRLHDEYMIDEYDFSSSGIHILPHRTDDLYDEIRGFNIPFRDFLEIVKSELSHFDEDDKYYILTDYLFTFSSIEELFETEYGNCVAVEFLENKDLYMNALKEITNE